VDPSVLDAPALRAPAADGPAPGLGAAALTTADLTAVVQQAVGRRLDLGEWQVTPVGGPATAISTEAVLQVHGTADTVIAYAGGMTTTKFPSAQQSVLDWVALDGCDATPDTSLPPLDLDNGLPGNETTIQRWATGCKAGSEAQLWTIVGGAHIPSLTNNFAPDVVGFLFDHPKP